MVECTIFLISAQIMDCKYILVRMASYRCLSTINNVIYVLEQK